MVSGAGVMVPVALTTVRVYFAPPIAVVHRERA